jgi:hypothetical protein
MKKRSICQHQLSHITTNITLNHFRLLLALQITDCLTNIIIPRRSHFSSLYFTSIIVVSCLSQYCNGDYSRQVHRSLKQSFRPATEACEQEERHTYVRRGLQTCFTRVCETTSLMRWSTTSKSCVLHDLDTLSRIARRLVDRYFDKQITERRGLLPFFKHGSSAVMQACLDRIGWHEDGEQEDLDQLPSEFEIEEYFACRYG